ncbi:DUF6460 domain-containing protein [uncultured Devosia sp.]|uniref:DUF6460 domain-containing protein n=1 Tax=uncultured Devosia sp. TaxID=211434 RepID=UPI0035CB1CD8
MSEQITDREPNSKLERVLGGSPGGVIVRLLLVSLVVGFLMSIFGLNVEGVVRGTIRLVEDTLRDSTGMLRSLGGYIVTGAALVVPIWLVLRLTSRRR